MQDVEPATDERRDVELVRQPRRQAEDGRTDGWDAARTETAPPIEKPTSRTRSAAALSIAASASSVHQSSRFHDLTR